jgi:hypothetical protein
MHPIVSCALVGTMVGFLVKQDAKHALVGAGAGAAVGAAVAAYIVNAFSGPSVPRQPGTASNGT